MNVDFLEDNSVGEEPTEQHDCISLKTGKKDFNNGLRFSPVVWGMRWDEDFRGNGGNKAKIGIIWESGDAFWSPRICFSLWPRVFRVNLPLLQLNLITNDELLGLPCVHPQKQM